MAAALAPVVAIVGPTASGKTGLALELARELGAEVVSCDSQQVYRGMDVGTAKPTAAEQRAVRHHLIDVADPDEVFSAASYGALAREALASLRARGVLPLVVGGTGLYFRALRHGLFEGPSRDDDLRRRLESLARRHGNARLHRLLAGVDPEAAARIEPQDLLRTVRALEVYRATGRPISSQQAAGARPLEGWRWLVVGLAPDRVMLKERVEQRTRAMLDAGLLDEARALVARGLSPELRPLQAIGYRQALAVVEGRVTEAEARASIVADTMRLAKRQMTWFRHQETDVAWFEDAGSARRAVLDWLGRSGSS